MPKIRRMYGYLPVLSPNFWISGVFGGMRRFSRFRPPKTSNNLVFKLLLTQRALCYSPPVEFITIPANLSNLTTLAELLRFLYVYDTGLGLGEETTIMVGPLAMGESATFLVMVHVPAEARDGDHDTAQIMVASVGGPTGPPTLSIQKADFAE
jgi:hypothetical protein